MDHHPLWEITLFNVKSRDKKQTRINNFYRLNGAIYLGCCNYIKQCKSFMGKETFAYIMPREMSIDIDCKKRYISQIIYI